MKMQIIIDIDTGPNDTYAAACQVLFQKYKGFEKGGIKFANFFSKELLNEQPSQVFFEVGTSFEEYLYERRYSHFELGQKVRVIGKSAILDVVLLDREQIGTLNPNREDKKDKRLSFYNAFELEIMNDDCTDTIDFCTEARKQGEKQEGDREDRQESPGHEEGEALGADPKTRGRKSASWGSQG